jgi:hypothetical protein
MANEELLSKLGPQLRRTREEFFVTKQDTTLTAGTATYGIPTRAMLGKVREVQLLDSDGAVIDLEEMALEEMRGRDPTDQDTPSAYTFQGNSVVLYPTPSAALTLRLWYMRRPNRLVSSATSTVGIVSSKTSTTVTMTAALPATFTTSQALDFIQANPHFDSLGDAATPSVVATPTLTFAAGVVPTSLAAGDFVCVAGDAPVLQFPVEVFYVLSQRVANQLMRGGTDAEALSEGEAELKSLESEVFGGAEERNEGEPAYFGYGGVFP